MAERMREQVEKPVNLVERPEDRPEAFEEAKHRMRAFITELQSHPAAKEVVLERLGTVKVVPEAANSRRRHKLDYTTSLKDWKLIRGGKKGLVQIIKRHNFVRSFDHGLNIFGLTVMKGKSERADDHPSVVKFLNGEALRALIKEHGTRMNNGDYRLKLSSLQRR